MQQEPEDKRSGLPDRRRTGRKPKRFARAMFYAHLWGGVLASVLLVVIAVTGIALNHKRGLGLMPDVPHEATAPFDAALTLADLAAAASAAVPAATAAAGVDRMDVRPADGLIKVRFDDAVVTEVTVDINTGAILHIGERNDVFLEKLHSGEIFGDGWVLLSDLAAVLLVLALLSGYWLWLYPRSRM